MDRNFVMILSYTNFVTDLNPCIFFSGTAKGIGPGCGGRGPMLVGSQKNFSFIRGGVYSNTFFVRGLYSKYAKTSPKVSGIKALAWQSLDRIFFIKRAYANAGGFV